jgi:hypothetical protein
MVRWLVIRIFSIIVTHLLRFASLALPSVIQTSFAASTIRT